MIPMRCLALGLLLGAIACNGSSTSDAGTGMEGGAPGDSAVEEDASEGGLIQDSGGPTTCTIPKGGSTCNGLMWQCDEGSDCTNAGACCPKLDMMKVGGSTCQ